MDYRSFNLVVYGNRSINLFVYGYRSIWLIYLGTVDLLIYLSMDLYLFIWEL